MHLMNREPQWPKRGLAGIVVLFVLTAVVVAAWFLNQKAVNSDPVGHNVFLSAKPTLLSPGIFLLGRTQPGAAYAVETSDGLVLIDSGIEADAATILDQLATLRLDVNGLRTI